MKLAKPCFDIGLMTDAIEAVEPFWRDRLCLLPDHVLPIEGAYAQHRYRIGDSIVKLNARPVDAGARSGYHELLIASASATGCTSLADADGNRVSIVPVGYRGVTRIAMRILVKDLAVHRHYYASVLGLDQASENGFCVGDDLILIETGVPGELEQSLWGRGWRYLTLQIFDVRLEHARYLAKGGASGMPIQQLRDIARVAMVRDPDGNWLELSQRASLTGPLG